MPRGGGIAWTCRSGKEEASSLSHSHVSLEQKGHEQPQGGTMIQVSHPTAKSEIRSLRYLWRTDQLTQISSLSQRPVMIRFFNKKVQEAM